MREWSVYGESDRGQNVDIHDRPHHAVVLGLTIRQAKQIVEAHNAQLAAQAADGAGQAERYRVALEEINAIRDTVIRTQRMGWSSVMYPLVAILNKAGFESTVTDEELSSVGVGNRLDNALAAAPPAPVETGAGDGPPCRWCGRLPAEYDSACEPAT